MNPLVIEPFEEIGTYGGIVRMLTGVPAIIQGYYRMVREPLVNYDNLLVEIHPNLAESWEVSKTVQKSPSISGRA